MFALKLYQCRKFSIRLCVFLVSLNLAVACVKPIQPPSYPTEILWDRWGVPHIFAPTETDLFYAFGWAQMQSQGELILRLYAQARGQGAEFLGETYLASDQATRLLGIPERGAQWYAQQSSAFQKNMDAFVDGMNDYARQHPTAVATGQALLPISGADVFRHLARLLALLTAKNSECGVLLPGLQLPGQPGGVSWALAPNHSISGQAMLLATLDLAWSGEQTLYEAHLVAPGVDLSGVTFVGLPTLIMGLNEHLAWSHTINPGDICDAYALALAGPSLAAGYRLDGQVHAIEAVTQTIKIKQTDGSLQEEPFTIQQSVQGPVVISRGQALAIRMAGQAVLPVAGLAEQWWAMGKAQNLAEFQAALDRGQLPLFNVVYADRAGHILGLTAVDLPRRSKGDLAFWSLPAPGDSSALVWTQAHPLHELPQVVDPPSGWVQNSGGTPWYMTMPPLSPGDYPPYLAPLDITVFPQFLREEQGLKLLTGQEKFSFAQFMAIAYNTRSELADRILDKLVAAARQSDSSVAQEAAEILAHWDRQANAGSRGMALFQRWQYHWVQQTFVKLSAAHPLVTGGDLLYGSALFYATPWAAQAPLETPEGLFSPLVAVRALETAAHELEQIGLPLDVAWGDVARFQLGAVDLPANGGPSDLGIFHAIEFAPGENGRLRAVGGAAYTLLVEFTDPVRAAVLLPYGNASQPASPHVGDQLVLAAQKELRPLLRTRSEIEANQTARTVLLR